MSMISSNAAFERVIEVASEMSPATSPFNQVNAATVSVNSLAINESADARPIRYAIPEFTALTFEPVKMSLATALAINPVSRWHSSLL